MLEDVKLMIGNRIVVECKIDQAQAASLLQVVENWLTEPNWWKW